MAYLTITLDYLRQCLGYFWNRIKKKCSCGLAWQLIMALFSLTSLKKKAIPKYLGTASGWYYKRLPLTYQCIEQGGQAQANQDEGEDHIPVI